MANELKDARLLLHKELKELLGNDNVYYQPPETLKIQYPCIIYELNRIGKDSADNNPYKIEPSYSVTLIHKDPDNDVVDRLINCPLSSFDKAYSADNLHHYVFTFFIRRKK